MNLFVMLVLFLTSIIISYFIGYSNGFNKYKSINDERLRELTNKYKQQLKEIS